MYIRIAGSAITVPWKLTRPAPTTAYKIIQVPLHDEDICLTEASSTAAAIKALSGKVTSMYRVREHDVEGFELSSKPYNSEPLGESGNVTPATTRTLSAQSSIAALNVTEPEDNAAIQELPPTDRGIKAWTFCASAFVIEMMIWGFSFSYGLFQDYYSTHPPFNTASGVAISAVGTVALAMMYGEAFFLSCLLGRYPDFFRMSMWAGLAIYFVSLFCSSFATEVWQLLLLQGVGVGLGGGMLYNPVIRLLPEWFVTRRGLAGGIVYSGTGLGGFVFPFVLNTLLAKVGLAWTLRIWAIGTSFFAGIACFGMKSRFPVPKFSAGQRRPKIIPPQLSFLKNALFISFAFTHVLQGLSYFPVSLYIASFTRKLGDQLTATVVLALFNSAATLGQVLLGYLTDRFPYPLVMVASALGSALGAFLLWGFASTTTYLYFFVIVFGCLSGGFSSTWSNASVECVGNQPEYAGMAVGAVSFAKGITAVIGPMISGTLLERGQRSQMEGGFGRFGYGPVEIFVGSCALASGVASVVVAVVRQRALKL